MSAPGSRWCFFHGLAFDGQLPPARPGEKKYKEVGAGFPVFFHCSIENENQTSLMQEILLQ
jgi:hypothetical protein